MSDGLSIAIVPARGGSKRIPRKNIRPFCGRPMIEWPIAAAIGSGRFDHVVVTTDDDEIAAVARSAGAVTPFQRPHELSDDFTPLRPVLKHAITASEAAFGQRVAYVCSILPTAAFVTSEDLQLGYEAVIAPDVDFVFVTGSFPSPVQRAMRRGANGGVEMLFPEHRFTRSQDLEECFYDLGQFYWGKRDPYLEDKPMYGPRTVPLTVAHRLARDIDTPEDWHEAELAFASILESRRAAT